MNWDFEIEQIKEKLQRQEHINKKFEEDIFNIKEKLNNKNEQDKIKLDNGEVIFKVGDIMYSGKICGFLLDSEDELTLKIKGYKEINFI